MKDWRLICEGAGEAAWNMAVDEAILEAVAVADQPPTLRIYQWAVPAVSIGRFQKPEQVVDLRLCQQQGVPVVRRLTGGKAVLHGHDLTLCVVAPLAEFAPAHRVIEVHQRIVQPIASALREVGITVKTLSSVDRRALRGQHALCFEHAFPGDLTTPDGVKIAGGAQYRRMATVMEQISLPLRPIPSVLLAVTRHAIFLPESPLQHVEVEWLQSAICHAFAREWGIQWRLQALSEAEAQRARRLRDSYLVSGNLAPDNKVAEAVVQ